MSFIRAGVGLCAFAVVFATSVRADVRLELIVYENGPAPNVPGQPGARFAFLEAPAFNDAGQFAFSAVLSHSSITDGKADGIWTGTKSQLHPIVREDDFAPGTPYRFESFSDSPLLGDGGHVLFGGRLDVPSSASDRDEGIWLSTPTGVKLVAQTGVSTGGTPFTLESLPIITTNGDYGLGDGGHVAFLGRLSNSANSLWLGTPEQMKVAAYDEMLLPAGTGFGSGARFASLSDLGGPAISAGGQLAFRADVRLSPSGSLRDTLWVATNDALQLVASEMTAPPGLPTNSFRGFNDPVMNNAGQVGFEASLDGFVESLWRGTPGNLELMLREGDPAPVGVPGAVFSGSDAFSAIRLNDAGELAFVGQFFYTGIPSSNNTGLFVVGDDGVRAVALEGQVGSVTTFSLNNAGEVAFQTLGDRIYATNQLGELNLVKGPDGSGTGLELRGGGTMEGEYSAAWNSNFQLAFTAGFGGTSGIYLATVYVPEASTASLLLIAVVAGMLRQRRCLFRRR